MPTRGSWGSYSVRSFLELVYRYRFRSNNVSLRHGSCSSSKLANSIGYGHPMNQELQMFTANGGTWKIHDAKKLKVIKDDMVRPSVPDPPRFNFPTWAKWVLGSILSLFLPFWKQKWEKLKMIEGQAEIVLEEVETVAAVVGKAAMAAEKFSAEEAEKLPDNGKLKKAALLVEGISKATAHDAQLTKDFIHKVDNLKHDLDDLETMVEPAIEKLIHHKSQVK
ncbi:uncharacterized protein LOC8266813 [Ricinus communis]|uniref:uncharacterized protein LOC8266813 n=1 Tax=Ricinus communis TaxID=3988 RepID=UPI00201B1397|nr:uncharacterized protein LOC8266813 [Ricinus communis]